tara:strand:+ start:417 stop:1424 length:1008 start_codon:yes stop_codon:yes gene_type:complete
VISEILKVENLTVRFEVKRGGGWTKKSYLYAVDDVSFAVKKGKTLAIVGESGSGKTTAALAVARLVNAQSGSVLLDGQDILQKQAEDLRKIRQKVQFIFQDPYSSLNPRKRAEAIVREPLDSLSSKSGNEKAQIVDELFEAVGLRPEQKRLFPHQFSGGQRQRIGIARALATQPELIICDEPVSALDVAVQAQILNLLHKLQKDFELTYLFISHDLGVVQHMSDSIAVMYMGKVVEFADRLSLFKNPQHPYTRALLSAVPTVNRTKRAEQRRILIPGDPPDPVNLPSGCRFANRCPIVKPVCNISEPKLETIANGHRTACHFVKATKSSLDSPGC